MGRFNLNVKQNFKDGMKKDALIDDGSAIIAAAIHTMLPGLLNKILPADSQLSGYGALAAGAGTAYLVGKAIGAPGISSAAIGLASAHLIYAEGSEFFEKNGIQLTRMQKGISDGGYAYPQLMGLSNDSEIITLPDGSQIIGRSGTQGVGNLYEGDRPQLTSRAGMHDHYETVNRGTNFADPFTVARDPFNARM